MWPRLTELLAGLYLMASPWIFSESDAFRGKDLVCGGLIVLLSALSWWPKTSWAHYFTGGVALWLGITTWMFIERPGPAAAQNEISVAVFLLMMFILPNRASEPPAGWRDEIARAAGDRSQ